MTDRPTDATDRPKDGHKEVTLTKILRSNHKDVKRIHKINSKKRPLNHLDTLGYLHKALCVYRCNQSNTQKQLNY